MIHQLAIALLASALQAGPAPSEVPATPAEAAAEFTRYQLILDRKPFGNVALAAAADDEAAVNPNIPPLSASLRLVALEKDDATGAIKAGLVDGGGKRSYYLKVGEEDDGVKLVNADFKGDRALIHKGAQEEWLILGASAANTSAGGAPMPTDAGNEIARRQRYRDMMNARMAQRGAPATLPPVEPPPQMATNHPHFKSNEEMNAYYRKINMDLIRAGGAQGPALPVPLTPEDDNKLVEEGVLPPVEATTDPE